MFKLAKFIFKWLLRLAVLAVVLVVIVLLSLNSILRVLVEHNIRAQTGMDAEIGRFKLGLTEPTMEIQNLKIYNPPEFAGTPFLDIREIHVEYDRAALLKHELHLTLLRFNLGELDIVKNEAGQTNIFALGLPASPKAPKPGTGAAELKKRTDLEFKSIDVLNVSIGTLKFIDLKNPQNNREQKIGIENLPIRNVKSETDLAGLMLIVGLRSGDFFESLLGLPKSGLNGI